jgi:hypothetical protein
VRSKPLILKKTASHCGNPWTDDDKDYVVLDAGQIIGRIMLHPQAPAGQSVVLTITARELIATDGRRRTYGKAGS